MATKLRSKFPNAGLTELASVEPQARAKESFEIATNIAYQNGALRGTPKAGRKECREVEDAVVLPRGYATTVKQIEDRLMMLADYRLADLLTRILAN